MIFFWILIGLLYLTANAIITITAAGELQPGHPFVRLMIYIPGLFFALPAAILTAVVLVVLMIADTMKGRF